MLATLRQFLPEGTPRRSLKASGDKASDSTLRRWLEHWTRCGVLAQVHAPLVATAANARVSASCGAPLRAHPG